MKQFSYFGNALVAGMSAVEPYLQLVEDCDGIDGRYSDVRRLGNDGGSGFTSLMFTAYDNQLGRRVALKVRRPNQDDPYRSRCFEREADVLHRFSGQPDIIGWVGPRSQFSVVLSKGDIQVPLIFSYFPMELAASNLAAVIAQEEWQPMRRLLAFRAMCRSVQRLHRQNTMHRDIKPDNFLIMPGGHIRLSDFGTARSTDERDAVLDDYMFPPGDRRYTSPELIACKPTQSFVSTYLRERWPNNHCWRALLKTCPSLLR